VRDGFACGSSGIFASRGKEFPDFHALWHIVGGRETVETLIDEKIRLMNDMDPNPQKI